MSEKKSDLKLLAGKAVVDNPLSESAFTDKSKRFPIASFSDDTDEDEGLLLFVFSYAKRGIRNAFRFSKMEWITLLVIVFIWAGTGILKSYNMDIPIVRTLAFLTASYNGLDTGIMSITGGIAAKSFVLAAIPGTLIPLVTSLFSGKRKTEYAGFSRFAKTIKTINIKSKVHLAMLLLGAGIAFAFYGFLSVNGGFQNNIVAILAALSIMKNFGNKTGFLSRFLSKALKGTMGQDGAYTVLIGMVTGYILSVPVSLKLSGISGIGYIIGTVAVVAGVILMIAGRSERKVKQSI